MTLIRILDDSSTSAMMQEICFTGGATQVV